jgi:hypothetical protein
MGARIFFNCNPSSVYTSQACLLSVMDTIVTRYRLLTMMCRVFFLVAMARTTTAVFRRKQTETPKRPFSRRVSHCATYTTAMVRYEMYQLRFIDRASVIPLMPSCCIYACVPRVLEARHTSKSPAHAACFWERRRLWETLLMNVHVFLPQCTTTTLSDSYSIEVVRCQSRQQLLCAVLTAYQKQRLGGGCWLGSIWLKLARKTICIYRIIFLESIIFQCIEIKK